MALSRDLEVAVQLSLREAAEGGRKTVSLRTDSGDVKRLEVAIPDGVRDGTRIRLAGQGAPGQSGGPAGDLYLRVGFAPDPQFTVAGHDLRVSARIAPWEAAL